MSVIHAIILGIIQGITEFLPVSSFGHLCGVQDLLGGTRGSGVLFEVMLHLGTMWWSSWELWNMKMNTEIPPRHRRVLKKGRL